MSRRHRWIAACLVPALLAGATAPAYANGAWQERSPEAKALAEGSAFEEKVRDYLRAYESGSAMARLEASNRVSADVFQSAGEPGYLARLRYLDSLMDQAPEATHALAAKLQLRWEARYAFGLGRLRKDTRDVSAIAGATVGFLVLGAALLRKPQAAPLYFRLFRQLFPLAGAWAGVAAGGAINAGRDALQHVPPAPASIMPLGLSSAETFYDDDQVEREVTRLLAGLSAGASAEILLASERVFKVLRAVRLANAAATPTKIHPAVLIGSLLVTLLVEQGVERGFDAYEFSKFKGRVQVAVTDLDAALACWNFPEAFAATEDLVNGAVNLSTYLRREFVAAEAKYQEDFEEILQEYGEGTHLYQVRMAEAADDLRHALQDLDAAADQDYQATMTLRHLLARNPEAIESMGPDAVLRARLYQKGFEAHYQALAARHPEQLRGSTLDSVLDRYLEQLLETKEAQLARELRAGKIRRHPLHILLQASALLKDTGNRWMGGRSEDLAQTLQQRSDELTALVARTQLADQLMTSLP